VPLPGRSELQTSAWGFDVGKGRQIKVRMRTRIDELGYSLPQLAEATGESYRNVHRWVREDIRVPAHFVALFAEAVPVDTRWLLTGNGTSDPEGSGPAEQEVNSVGSGAGTGTTTGR